eukprot:scaffold14651_cov34-Prasinocladus_malaysianus.AAC.1
MRWVEMNKAAIRLFAMNRHSRGRNTWHWPVGRLPGLYIVSACDSDFVTFWRPGRHRLIPQLAVRRSHCIADLRGLVAKARRALQPSDHYPHVRQSMRDG